MTSLLPVLALLLSLGAPRPETGESHAEHFVLLQAADHPAGRARVAVSPLLADVDPFVRGVGVLRRTRIETTDGALLLESEYVFEGTALRVVHTEERRPPGESILERLLWRELLGPRSRTLRAEIESSAPDQLRIVDAARGDTWHSQRSTESGFAFPALWLEDFVAGNATLEPALFDPTTRETAPVEFRARPLPGLAPLWFLELTPVDGPRSARVFCGRSLLAYSAGEDAPLAVRVGRDRYDIARRRATRDLRQEAADEALRGTPQPLASADARNRR